VSISQKVYLEPKWLRYLFFHLSCHEASRIREQQKKRSHPFCQKNPFCQGLKGLSFVFVRRADDFVGRTLHRSETSGLSLDFVGRADDFVGRADGFFRKSHQHRNKREVRLKSQIFDPGRTRTYNLRFRRPMPYPLGHRASRGLKTESVKLMLQGTVSSVDRTPRPGIESGSSA
jgi:hypothetical protein